MSSPKKIEVEGYLAADGTFRLRVKEPTRPYAVILCRREAEELFDAIGRELGSDLSRYTEDRECPTVKLVEFEGDGMVRGQDMS